MKLFLSSQGLVNEQLTEQFLSFSENCHKVLIITTAAEIYKEKNKHNIQLKAQLDYLGFHASFIDVACENPEPLKHTELIIMNGGNPYYLLYHLKKSGADQILKTLIKDEVPVKGISAGLLVFMHNLAVIDLLTPHMNTVDLADKNGLGLVDEIIIPHYDRFVQEGIFSAELIDDFASKSTQEVIRLGEFQAVLYEGENRRILGELML